jgi:hypothetical protein
MGHRVTRRWTEVMEEIIWPFLAFIVALVALGAVLVSIRPRHSSLEPNPGGCSSRIRSGKSVPKTA